MSGAGKPTDDTRLGDPRGLRVAVVAATWHTEVMDGLIDGSLRALAEAGLDATAVVRVPGTVELSVACTRLAPQHDALVALGVVIRGGTPHFDYVCQSVTWGLTEIAVRTGVPIGFGVLTCDTHEQALARAGLPGSSEDKGYEAAMAAIDTATTLRTLAGTPAPPTN
ncbi:MAG: 6,7-dimethyl-8-ribityllumazine synthase [Nostocoides sp.]